MRAALAWIFSRHGAAVLLLMVLLPAELASLAFAADERHERRCGCQQDSCPMRSPAKAVQAEPPCHGDASQTQHGGGHHAAGSHHAAGGHHAAQPEPAPGSSCSLRASCGCGHPHSPAAPHQAPRAVLEPVVTALPPLSSGFLTLLDGPGCSDLLPDPESPPPRFPVPA